MVGAFSANARGIRVGVQTMGTKFCRRLATLQTFDAFFMGVPVAATRRFEFSMRKSDLYFENGRDKGEENSSRRKLHDCEMLMRFGVKSKL